MLVLILKVIWFWNMNIWDATAWDGTAEKVLLFIGTHVHEDLLQWYLNMPGSSFTYHAGDETVSVESSDITFTEIGSPHGSEASEGQCIDYVWFELAINGYIHDDDILKEHIANE